VDSGLTELCRFFTAACQRREPLVLATIVCTEGSTYRKAGARILISQSGATSGLLSGGCLEADLCERAARVLARGQPERAVFDSRVSDDPVWGIGLGCEGANHIWLQAATEANDYAPLRYLNSCLTEEHTGIVTTIIGGDALPSELGHHGCADIPGRDPLAAKLSACLSAKPEIQTVRYLDRMLEVFVAPVVLPPSLLLCGAGPDAVPVAKFADLLGWRVTVIDHRPTFASPANFPPPAKVIVARPREMIERLNPSKFDAAVIMGHNLTHDIEYLRCFVSNAPGYIGLLGPPSRRARIFEEVGPAVHQIAPRIRGPVGLDIGANAPSGIALSIVAQIHAVLCGKDEAADAYPQHDYQAQIRMV
jgi:xanthine/CO dehydrogenase XdhC/CoxF family maturation factor